MKRKKAAAKRPPRFKPSLQLTDRQEFQKAYAGQWLAILKSAPFREAMYLLNKEKLDRLARLSDEQIERNGREILADLRGHFIHENELLTLHSKEEGLPTEEIEEYFSPEQVADLDMMRQRFREQNQTRRYAT